MTPPTPHAGTLWAGMTVGLLGGSFNPAHDGHRHISLMALQRLGLDAVWWMVSPQNPLKAKKGMAPMDRRLRDAQKAARHPKIVVTDIERHLGTRHTARTLAHLQRLFPRTRFVWLMGADNLRQIHLWEEWRSIFARVPVCVVDRPPRSGVLRACSAGLRLESRRVDGSRARCLAALPLPAWTVLHTPLNTLSATQIRAARQKA